MLILKTAATVANDAIMSIGVASTVVRTSMETVAIAALAAKYATITELTPSIEAGIKATAALSDEMRSLMYI